MKAKRTTKAKKGPWNKGKQVGQKLPLKAKEIRAIRVSLKSAPRDLALFNLAIDSGLSSIDLVRLRVRDVATGGRVSARAKVTPIKAKGVVQFDLSSETQASLAAWIAERQLKPGQFLFASRLSESPHISTRQYARALDSWVSSIGLDPRAYGTHSIRRTRATLIYGQTKDLEAVQAGLGHSKKESSARFLGLESSATRYKKAAKKASKKKS